MLSVLDLTRVKRLLCLGAHCDDIEIGAGGTIMHLAKVQPRDRSEMGGVRRREPERVEEARRSAEVFLAGTSTKSEIVIHGFRDGFFPFQGELLKETFEDLKSSFAPDLILTHHDDDRHQDHRLVSQLTWNTWRDHMILEYEIMKYDGDLGRPNLFVPLSQDVCQDKIGSLLEVFPSQSKRQWFNEEAFWSLLRLARHRVQRAFAALPKHSSCARSWPSSARWNNLERAAGLHASRDGSRAAPNGGTTDCRPPEGSCLLCAPARGKASLASCPNARAFGQEEHYEQHGVLRLCGFG